MQFRNLLINTPARPGQTESLAVETALRIAANNATTATVFDVVSDLSWLAQHVAGGWEEIFESMNGTKRARLQTFADQLSKKGISAESKVSKGRLSKAIIRQVKDRGHDLVIKVAEKSSNRSGIIGSTDMRLIHNCPCAVLILRPDDQAGFQQVAVAADVLDQSKLQRPLDHQAVQAAHMLASDGDSEPISLVYALPPLKSVISLAEENVDLVSIEQMEQWGQELKEKAKTRLEELAAAAPKGEYSPHVLVGDPVTAIPEFTNGHGTDLLVIGNVGRSGTDGLFLGNTAERILEQVDCSVLVVKPLRETSPLAAKR